MGNTGLIKARLESLRDTEAVGCGRKGLISWATIKPEEEGNEGRRQLKGRENPGLRTLKIILEAPTQSPSL